MRAQRGFAWIQIAAVAGVVAAAVTTVALTYRFGYSAGRDGERAVWQARELEQQHTYEAEIERLRAKLDGEIARFNAAIANAAAKHQKEAVHARRKSDRFIADVRAGRVVLRDPGATACPAGGSEPPASTAAARPGNGEKGGGLSVQAAEFLFRLAAEADSVVEQLTLAQNVITAYYELCKH